MRMCPLGKLIRVNSRHRPTNLISRSQSGRLVKGDGGPLDSSGGTEKPTKKLLLESKYVKYIGIPLILVMFIIVMVALVLIFFNKPEDAVAYEPPHIDDHPSLQPLKPGDLIDRSRWGGRPSLNFTKPLRHPTPFVIISHSVTPFCTNFKDCSLRVASIQTFHVGQLESPDIGYNFLIGGDALVYVGRGWDIVNFHSNDSIGICFIGNYIYDSLTQPMIQSAKNLLELGVKQGKLSKSYRLIAHNQTYATESPGTNVYGVIKTWPHFDPRQY